MEGAEGSQIQTYSAKSPMVQLFGYAQDFINN